MTPDEALVLITYASEKWGNAAALPDDPDLLALRVQVWMDALRDIDPSLVRAVLASAMDEFPPHPRLIRSRCDELLGNIPDLPSWDEFWPWVRALARRCTDFLPERSGGQATVGCPWPALEGIITPSLLAGWASSGLTEHDLEFIEQAHIRRHFESRSTRVVREGATDVPALNDYRQQIAALADSKRLELGESA